MAEPRHSSLLAWADSLGSDETPCDDEEYIEMGAKVKSTASTFSNKKIAKYLVEMILFLHDLEEWKSWLVGEIFANFFLQLIEIRVL